MHQSRLIKTNLILSVVLMAYVPFHAFISVWLASIFGHYTITRLIEEFILLVMLVSGIYLFISNFQTMKKLVSQRLILFILVFLVIQLGWGIIFYLLHEVNAKALFYGLLLNTRYFIFFLLTYQAYVLKTKFKLKFNISIPKLVLGPAIVVVIFGLLEVFFLPKDFLRHFGYGTDTILPFETINHNDHYIRIMSTLRGANPLGAYLIIPISLLGVLIVRSKKILTKENSSKIVLLILVIVTLYFSFSRSAYIGAILSLLIVVYLGLRNNKIKKLIPYLLAAVIVSSISTFILFRNNLTFQNVVLHTQKNSVIKTSSNQGHSSAVLSAIEDILKRPLGMGPGSSGQASLYNNHPAKISENYFLQVGQEVGIIGLVLFLIIIFLFLKSTYTNRSDDTSLFVLAALVGAIIINLFSLGFSDDTLSFVLFGLLAFNFGKKGSSKI